MASPTKLHIARTARRLFLADGVEGVSMRRIADEVEVTVAAIYRHFRDKQQLLEEVTEEGFEIFRSYLVQGLGRGTPIDELRELAHGYLEFALAHPHHYDFIFTIPRKNVRRFPSDFSRRKDLTFHVLVQCIERAMRARLLVADDATEVALSFWAHVHGLVALHRAGRFGRNHAEVRRLDGRSIDRLLAGLCVQQRRPRSPRRRTP